MRKKQIVSKTPVKLTRAIVDILADLAPQAAENAKHIHVEEIVYKSLDHLVLGFVVYPSDTEQKKKLPCIIWNRGGSLKFGSIKIGQLFIEIADLARAGYFVIATQYSGWGKSGGVDEFGGADLNDVLVLKDVLGEYPQADLKNIGMYGWSRGGMMTYQALSQTDWIKAAVVGGAPTNEVRAPEYRPNWRNHQIKMYGGSKEQQIKRSAVYWSNSFPKNVPLLIMHGLSDWRVNPLDSLDLSTLLLKEGVPHRLILFEGEDHGITRHQDEVKRQTLKWFNRFIKNNENPPNTNPHGV